MATLNTDDLNARINGVEGIIFELVANNEVIKFLNFDLHPKPINVQNNDGLSWIWGQLLGLQVIGLYKLFKDSEKHSLEKLLNIINVEEFELDSSLVDRLNALKVEYSNESYGAIRSKFLAHQDINVPLMGVNLFKLDQFITDICKWFNELKIGLSLGPVPETKEIRDALAEIFESIENWDRVQGFLLIKLLKGKKTVRISDLEKLIS